MNCAKFGGSVTPTASSIRNRRFGGISPLLRSGSVICLPNIVGSCALNSRNTWLISGNRSIGTLSEVAVTTSLRPSSTASARWCSCWLSDTQIVSNRSLASTFSTVSCTCSRTWPAIGPATNAACGGSTSRSRCCTSTTANSWVVAYSATAALIRGSSGSGATVATQRSVFSVVRAAHSPTTLVTRQNAASTTSTAARPERMVRAIGRRRGRASNWARNAATSACSRTISGSSGTGYAPSPTATGAAPERSGSSGSSGRAR